MKTATKTVQASEANKIENTSLIVGRNRREIVRLLKDLLAFTEPDACRFGLSGILLEIRGGNLTFVASDGKRLMAVSESVGSEDFEFNVIISRDFVKSLKAGKPSEGIEFNLVKSTYSDLLFCDGVAVDTVDNRYPRYRDVFQRESEVICTYSGTIENWKKVVDVDIPRGIELSVRESTNAVYVRYPYSPGGSVNLIREIKREDSTPCVFNPDCLGSLLKFLDLNDKAYLTLAFDGQCFESTHKQGEYTYKFVAMGMTR